MPKTRLFKFLKTRSLHLVNDCFKNENNAIFGVLLQKLIRGRKMIYIPSLLVIAGNGRNTGKTWLACSIIKSFGKNADVLGIKISPHFHNYKLPTTEKTFYYTEELNSEIKKDSSLMLMAGAKKVFYIEAKDKGIQANTGKIINLIDNAPCICESGGIVNFIKPGLFIYIQNEAEVKNPDIKKKADIILDNNDGKVYFDLLNLSFKNGKWVYNH